MDKRANLRYIKDNMGTEKHSKASKERWADVSKEDRKERMSIVALARWNKMSVKDKKEYAQMMVDAKRKKHENKTV